MTAPSATVSRQQIIQASRFAPAPTVLVTSPIGWALTVASTLVVLSLSDTDLLSEATSAQLAEITGLLVLRGSAWLLACCWGAVGVGLVARRLVAVGGPTRAYAAGSLVAGAVAVVAALGQLASPLAAVGFSQPRFGDTTAYANYLAASLISIWAALVAVVLVALALRTAGVRRTAVTTLAAACVVYLVVDVVTRGSVPPFAVAAVWLALGLLLRAPRVPA